MKASGMTYQAWELVVLLLYRANTLIPSLCAFVLQLRNGITRFEVTAPQQEGEPCFYQNGRLSTHSVSKGETISTEMWLFDLSLERKRMNE